MIVLTIAAVGAIGGYMKARHTKLKIKHSSDWSLKLLNSDNIMSEYHLDYVNFEKNGSIEGRSYFDAHTKCVIRGEVTKEGMVNLTLTRPNYPKTTLEGRVTGPNTISGVFTANGKGFGQFHMQMVGGEDYEVKRMVNGIF